MSRQPLNGYSSGWWWERWVLRYLFWLAVVFFFRGLDKGLTEVFLLVSFFYVFASFLVNCTVAVVGMFAWVACFCEVRFRFRFIEPQKEKDGKPDWHTAKTPETASERQIPLPHSAPGPLCNILPPPCHHNARGPCLRFMWCQVRI